MAFRGYVTFLVTFGLLTKLPLFAGQLSLQCNFKVVNEKAKLMKSIPVIERDTTAFFIEYKVSYTNDNRSNIDSTFTSTRFQPNRWFLVHETATMELQLMYDSYFEVLSWLLIYSITEIEITVTPSECLQSTNTDELDNLTRHFLVHKFQTPSYKLCSAHIADHDGEGRLGFRCCKSTSDTEIECSDIHEDNLLYKLHVFSIIVTIFILLSILYQIIRNVIGSDVFTFHPKGLRIELTINGESNKKHSEVLSIPKQVYDKMPCLKTSVGNENYVDALVETMTLEVKRKKCCSEGKINISFVRSIVESIIYLKSIVKKMCKTRCKNNCQSFHAYCGCLSLENLSLAFILLLFYAPSIPLVWLYFQYDLDYMLLCSAYNRRDLKCPFYLIDKSKLKYLLWFTTVIYFFCCIVLLVLVCRNSMLQKATHIIILILIGISFSITWCLGLHFIVYSFIRSVVTSAITKNTLDDISPMMLPLMFFVKDKIVNVSKRYKGVVETFLKYFEINIKEKSREDKRKVDTEIKDQFTENSLTEENTITDNSRSENEQKGHNTTQGNDNASFQNVDESRDISIVVTEEKNEFKYLISENKSDIAANEVIVPLASKEISDQSSKKDGQNIAFTMTSGSVINGEDKIIVRYDKLYLQYSQPLVFCKTISQRFISKRLIVRLANGFSKSLIRKYIEVLALSLGTCLMFLLLFYLFIAYGTVFSYSNEIIGYTAFFLTFLNIIKEQFTDSVNTSAPVLSSASDDNSFLLNLQDKLTGYYDKWIVKDITLKKDNCISGKDNDNKRDLTTLHFNIQDSTCCSCRKTSVSIHDKIKNKHNIKLKTSTKNRTHQNSTSV